MARWHRASAWRWLMEEIVYRNGHVINNNFNNNWTDKYG